MKTKIFIIIISCFCIWNSAVYANNGDISSTLYNTDIITYFDGKQIEGYSLDGRMMICLEDLKNYGYTVEYDDSMLTKTGKWRMILARILNEALQAV